MAAFSAAGFAVGAFFPSRFAAPLAAFGGFLAMMMSSQTGFSQASGWALILPTNSNGNFQPVSGIFYPYLPDLPIARIMFLAGIAVAALGLLGLPAGAGGPGCGGPPRWSPLAGVAAAGTAVGLADTARLGPHGMVIPALHDAASDRPIPYTPVCGRAAGVPVCVNPAYRRYLPDVTAALRPVLAEVAGLPGAPARAAQVAGGPTPSGEGGAGRAVTIGGRPPVLRMPLDALSTLPRRAASPGTPRPRRSSPTSCRLLAVHAFVGAGNGAGTPAQQAVQAALLQSAGDAVRRAAQVLADAAGNGPRAPAPGPSPPERHAAARRLAALPPAARHAWLAAHLAALRAGQLTLAAAAMTAAGVHRPPPGCRPGRRRPARPRRGRPAPGVAVRGQPPDPGRARRCWPGCGALLWAALHWRWNIAGGPAAQELVPLVVETGAAAIIAVTTYGPFGEPERATGRWLPWLRLAAALALTAAAFGLLAAGATGGALPGGTLALLRNLAGMTGTGLLCRGRARRRVRLDRPDGLLADHRVRAGRGLDHAVDLAGPAAARPRRRDLRRPGVRRRDRGRHGARRPRHRPPVAGGTRPQRTAGRLPAGPVSPA